MGGWQTMDVNGNAVRQDGWLTQLGGAPSEPYATIADYMKLLTQDPRVSDCMTSRVSQFAYGRPMADSDSCMLQDIATRIGSAQSATFATVVTAIAANPSFVTTSVQ
jgi:hypothetical protein